MVILVIFNWVRLPENAIRTLMEMIFMKVIMNDDGDCDDVHVAVIVAEVGRTGSVNYDYASAAVLFYQGIFSLSITFRLGSKIMFPISSL